MNDLRDRIRAVDIPTLVVAVAEWGEKVAVRSMTGREAYEFGQKYPADDGDVDIPIEDVAGLIVRHVVDPDTQNRVFTDDDAEWLADQPAGVLITIQQAILEVSGMDEEGSDRAGKASTPLPETAS